MPVEIIDKRTTDANDEIRLRKRADTKEKATRLQFEKDKIPVLEAVLAESHARVDAATDAHSAACGPLQTELETLETEAVERVRRREQPDQEADARRVEILREVAAENATLEGIIEAEKVFRQPTEAEVWRLKNRVLDPNAILMKLGQPPLASPALLVEQHVRGQRTDWLRARQHAAERSLKIRSYNTTEIRAGRMSGDLSVQMFHVVKWEGELAAVGAELVAALAEGKAAHQAMIDE